MSLLREPRRGAPEYSLHCLVADWLRLALDPTQVFWTTLEHGGWRHAATAGRMKRVNVRAGIPDIMLVMPGGLVFFIELKARDGVISAAQKLVHEELRRTGASVFVCWSLEDVQCALDNMRVPLRLRLEKFSARRGRQQTLDFNNDVEGGR